MDTRMGSLEKNMSALTKMTEILVEEKVRKKGRKKAVRHFGEDYSRNFTIKSPHDLVKILLTAHISLQNVDKKGKAVRLKKDDYDSRHAAALMIGDLLEEVSPSFRKNAVLMVKQALDSYMEKPELHDKIEGHKEFEDVIKAFSDNAVRPVKEAKTSEALKSLPWGNILGHTIKLVTYPSIEKGKKGSEADCSPEIEAWKKIMEEEGFKSKLDRIKQDDFTTCKGPGVMFLSALAGAGMEVWKDGVPAMQSFIEESQFDVFKYKKEIECDCTPCAECVQNTATIQVGEIKTSISARGDAHAKMKLTANTIHFVLFFLTGKEYHVVKKGHLFVLERIPEENSRNQSPTFETSSGISIFIHQTQE